LQILLQSVAIQRVTSERYGGSSWS
jgi:hypothetical protein